MIMSIIEAMFFGVSLPEVALAANRMALGLAFFLSGYHKTFFPERHKALIETLQYAKVPFPRIMCWPVCLTELFAGLGLVFGILSGLSALAVIVLSLVATLTVEIWTIKDMKPQDAADWVDDLFWLPSVLFIIMGAIILFVGPGYGLDEVAHEMVLAAIN